MKSVLISIQPKWVEKIIKGEKTIEVRKTRPKIKTPFNCYIYMSQGDLKDLGSYSEWIYKNRMKLIGEFVCDEIIKDERGENADLFTKKAGLSLEEQKDYGKNKPIYGWHISKLKIYDKPLSLSKLVKNGPPQSWQYVEEI